MADYGGAGEVLAAVLAVASAGDRGRRVGPGGDRPGGQADRLMFHVPERHRLTDHLTPRIRLDGRPQWRVHPEFAGTWLVVVADLFGRQRRRRGAGSAGGAAVGTRIGPVRPRRPIADAVLEGNGVRERRLLGRGGRRHAATSGTVPIRERASERLAFVAAETLRDSDAAGNLCRTAGQRRRERRTLMSAPPMCGSTAGSGRTPDRLIRTRICVAAVGNRSRRTRYR